MKENEDLLEGQRGKDERTTLDYSNFGRRSLLDVWRDESNPAQGKTGRANEMGK